MAPFNILCATYVVALLFETMGLTDQVWKVWNDREYVDDRFGNQT